jgi:hypothetical protein
MKLVNDNELLSIICQEHWFLSGNMRRCESHLLQLYEQADDYARFLAHSMKTTQIMIERRSKLSATPNSSAEQWNQLRRQTEGVMSKLVDRYRRLNDGTYRYCLPSPISISYCDVAVRDLRENLVHSFETLLKDDTDTCCEILSNLISDCAAEVGRNV